MESRLPLIFKAFRPVVPERKLELVDVRIEPILEVHAPSKLEFAAHRDPLHRVVEKIRQRVMSLMEIAGRLAAGIVDIQHGITS